MIYEYKLFKYQTKNKLLINGGNGELTEAKNSLIFTFIEMYKQIVENPDFLSKSISVVLNRLINKHKWLHIPSLHDVGLDILNQQSNPFNVTKYWHNTLRPHSKIYFDTACENCSTMSKLDKRSNESVPQLAHHVDQHLFKISKNYLYTYNLITCSCLILIQNNVVGMMHIDAGNTKDDILEFFEKFQLETGELNETLKIHGFFNNEMYDAINGEVLFSIYELIITQYNKYGHNIFSNIFINLPFHELDKPNLDALLYIFAFPDNNIKGFYVDCESEIEKYTFTEHFIKIHEQKLKNPDLMVKTLKSIISKNQCKIIINAIDNGREIEDSESYDFLVYLLEIDANNILILKNYLSSFQIEFDKLLEQPN